MEGTIAKRAYKKMKTLFRILATVTLALLLSGCGISNDLTQILYNVQQHLNPLWSFLIALCWVLGFLFMGTAILKLKSYGQQTVMMSSHASMGPALAYVVVGAGLIYTPHLLDTLYLTLWNYGIHDVKGYGDAAGGSIEEIMGPITQVIQVIGLIAFIRGWISLLRLGHQGSPPGTLSKGLLHMTGGILAINIMGTLDVLKATFGLS